jgi:hypothetical protein
MTDEKTRYRAGLFVMTTPMRVRSFVAIAAILVGIGLAPHSAHASPKGDIQAKIKEAMENYDLMDYDAAKKSLTQALAIAKKAKLDKDPLVAKAYLDLGIVSYVNQDPDAAKLNFLSAIQIDPKIQIEPAYKSAEMAKLLESVRAEASGGGEPTKTEPVEPPAAAGVDCSTVQGLQHTIIDEAKAGGAVPIEALIGADVTATRVAVLYRPEGATDFTEVKLKKEGDCKYTGSIPAAAMKGSLVHYYVAAYGDGPKPVASKGSSGSPNIIEISGVAAAGAGDNEDPIGGATGGGGGGGGASVSSGVEVGPKKARVLIAVAGGTGFGYVTGTTEGDNMVKNCCIGSSLVVVQPEIGYFVNPKLSISIAGRIGFPLGANVEGHATAAPGGVLRVRFGLSPDGQGLRVMGQVGAGIMRNTIKLDNSMPGMDTDVVAQGPLLVGGGIGFTKKLAGSVSFIADFSALAGIAVVDHLGSAPKLNSGVGADLSIGFQLGL